MAKLHFGNALISLPPVKSVHLSGEDIVFTFKTISAPFVVRGPADLWLENSDEENYGLQEAHEKKLVSEELPKGSRCKKSKLG